MFRSILKTIYSNDIILKSIKVSIKIIIGAITLFAFFPGMGIEGKDQLAISTSMLTVSAIIFGVVGAWISLIKQDTEKKLAELIELRKPTQALLSKVEDLSNVIAVSCVILLTCLLYTFLYYSIRELSFIQENKEILRGVSFSTLVFLGLCQARLIIKIVFYGVDQVLDLYRLKDRLEDDVC